MPFLFLVTVPSLEEGKKIASTLIQDKTVACVNIIRNIYSIYRWKGKIEEDMEHLLIIKTTEEKSEELIKTIEEVHSYETPECIGFKIEKGSNAYLTWLRRVVEKDKNED